MEIWKRLALAGAEAAVASAVIYLVTRPARLTLLRAQVLHRAMLAARGLAATAGRSAITLEAAYDRTIHP